MPDCLSCSRQSQTMMNCLSWLLNVPPDIHEEDKLIYNYLSPELNTFQALSYVKVPRNGAAMYFVLLGTSRRVTDHVK